MKNTIRILLLLFLLASCRKNETTTEPVRLQEQERTQQYIPAPEPPAPPNLTFDKVNEKGVLIGHAIELLDSTLTEMQDISDYSELMVKITAVSRTYHYSYNPYNPDTLHNFPCQKFRYVKIKTSDFEGIVEGQFVYKLVESPANKIIKTSDNKIEFLATSNYGAKNSGDDENTPCNTFTPVLFREKKSNYEGLITLLNRQVFGIHFPYLEIDTGKESEYIPVKVTGSNFELMINSKFEVGHFKGDDPAPPASVRIRRENNGKFTGKLIGE